MSTIKTSRGVFIADPSGLFHYLGDSSNIYDDAADAIEHKPEGPAWFWFEDVPVPMCVADSRNELTERWQQWRKDCPFSFFMNVQNFALSQVAQVRVELKERLEKVVERHARREGLSHEEILEKAMKILQDLGKKK